MKKYFFPALLAVFSALMVFSCSSNTPSNPLTETATPTITATTDIYSTATATPTITITPELPDSSPYHFTGGLEGWEKQAVYDGFGTLEHATNPGYTYGGTGGSAAVMCDFNNSSSTHYKGFFKRIMSPAIDMTGLTITAQVLVTPTLAGLASPCTASIAIYGNLGWQYGTPVTLNTPGWNAVTWPPSAAGEGSVIIVGVYINNADPANGVYNGYIALDEVSW